MLRVEESEGSFEGRVFTRYRFLMRDLTRLDHVLQWWSVSQTVLERLVRVVPLGTCGDVVVRRTGERITTRYVITPVEDFVCEFCFRHTDDSAVGHAAALLRQMQRPLQQMPPPQVREARNFPIQGSVPDIIVHDAVVYRSDPRDDEPEPPLDPDKRKIIL